MINNKKSRGFTLIELLVVIAVIGLLSSVVLVQLGPVRGKARDARRMSDIKQISDALEVEAADNPEPVAGCVTADAKIDTCTGPVGSTIASFVNFADPSAGKTGTACATGVVTPCQYSISKSDGSPAAETGNYQVCFYLEQGAGSLSAGLQAIETSGVFTTCQ